MSRSEDQKRKERADFVSRGVAGGIAGGIGGYVGTSQGTKELIHPTLIRNFNSASRWDGDFDKAMSGLTHVKKIGRGLREGGADIYRTNTGKEITFFKTHMGGDAALPILSSRTKDNDSLRESLSYMMHGGKLTKEEMEELAEHVKSSKAQQNYVRTGGNASVVLHELGHTAGTRHGTPSGFLRRLGYYKAGPMANVLAGAGAMTTTRRAGESKEDYDKRSLKNSIKSGLVGSALHIPTLAEEARATLNANRLGKKLGVKVDNKRLLIPAYATYLAGASVPMGTALGAHYGKKLFEKNSAYDLSKGDPNAINARIQTMKVHEGLKSMIGSAIVGGLALASTDSAMALLPPTALLGAAAYHHLVGKKRITEAEQQIRKEEHDLIKQMANRKRR